MVGLILITLNKNVIIIISKMVPNQKKPTERHTSFFADQLTIHLFFSGVLALHHHRMSIT